MNLNDLSNEAQAAGQAAGQWAYPAILGAFVTFMRINYKGGRKTWKASMCEALLIAAAAGSVGPLLAYLGMPINLAYPIAVFVGHTGIYRISQAVLRKLGMDSNN